MGHDSLTLRSCQHIGTQTDDTARGDIKLNIDSLALILHRRHLTLTTSHHINHLRRELLGHVDRQFLDRLALLAVNLLIDNLGLTHLKLIALTAHGLNQHGEVEHTAT